MEYSLFLIECSPSHDGGPQVIIIITSAFFKSRRTVSCLLALDWRRGKGTEVVLLLGSLTSTSCRCFWEYWTGSQYAPKAPNHRHPQPTHKLEIRIRCLHREEPAGVSSGVCTSLLVHSVGLGRRGCGRFEISTFSL